MSPDRAIARVKHGTADFTPSTPSPEEDRRLRARYAATRYRVVAQPQLDLFALNTHRPLFADARTRQAVNYAIDRSKLDALGDGYVPLPEHETDHYIPPGLPGYRDAQVYPPHPDLAKARQLATPRARNTLVLLVCQEPPCAQEAAIVRTDLRRIGLRVRIEAPPDAVLGTRQRQGAGWDMAWLGWIRDYPDPSAMLNELLSSDTVLPRLADPGFQARLAAADRLTGARRYLAYEQLDADLKRYAAPLVAFGNLSSREFLSARVGCAFDSVYGIDLGALCAR